MESMSSNATLMYHVERSNGNAKPQSRDEEIRIGDPIEIGKRDFEILKTCYSA